MPFLPNHQTKEIPQDKRNKSSSVCKHRHLLWYIAPSSCQSCCKCHAIIICVVNSGIICSLARSHHRSFCIRSCCIVMYLYQVCKFRKLVSQKSSTSSASRASASHFPPPARKLTPSPPAAPADTAVRSQHRCLPLPCETSSASLSVG